MQDTGILLHFWACSAGTQDFHSSPLVLDLEVLSTCDHPPTPHPSLHPPPLIIYEIKKYTSLTDWRKATRAPYPGCSLHSPLLPEGQPVCTHPLSVPHPSLGPALTCFERLWFTTNVLHASSVPSLAAAAGRLPGARRHILFLWTNSVLETVLQFRIKTFACREDPADEPVMEKRVHAVSNTPPPRKFFWRKRGSQAFCNDAQISSYFSTAARGPSLRARQGDWCWAVWEDLLQIYFRPDGVFKPTPLSHSTTTAVLHRECFPALCLVPDFWVSLEWLNRSNRYFKKKKKSVKSLCCFWSMRWGAEATWATRIVLCSGPARGKQHRGELLPALSLSPRQSERLAGRKKPICHLISLMLGGMENLRKQRALHHPWGPPSLCYRRLRQVVFLEAETQPLN